MVEATTFRGALEFLDKIGVYDVILPFLLIFTIVFAILEKTKVLGTEEIKGVKYTKKNLNSIIAFAVAFIVVASTRLVAAINQIMANIVLLLLLSISFLLLIGSFFKEDEDVYLKEGPWRTFFMLLMFVGIVIIFLNSFTVSSDHISDEGELVCRADSSWLSCGWSWLMMHWQTNFVATIVLLVFIVLFMYYIVQGGRPSQQAKKEEKS